MESDTDTPASYKVVTSSFAVVSSSCVIAASIFSRATSVSLVGLPDFGKLSIDPCSVICLSSRHTVWQHVVIHSSLKADTISACDKSSESICRIRALAYMDNCDRRQLSIASLRILHFAVRKIPIPLLRNGTYSGLVERYSFCATYAIFSAVFSFTKGLRTFHYNVLRGNYGGMLHFFSCIPYY